MNLNEIKEALSKATPGPWECHESDDGHEIRLGTAVDSPGNCEVQHLIEYDHGLWEEDEEQYAEAEANANLIANAPQWLASLVAEVERLKEERHKLAEFVKDMIRDGCWNIDGGDLQDKAERNGFLQAEEYDPSIHGEDFDGDPGDTIYVFAGLLKGDKP